MSAPCNHCFSLIKKCGIQKIKKGQKLGLELGSCGLIGKNILAGNHVSDPGTSVHNVHL